MGKEKLFSTEEPNWNSSNFGMEIQPPPNHHHQQLNCGSDQLPNCFYNPNWDNSMDQSDPFESALSSMVSSPVAASNITGIPGGDGDGVVLRELIGRLGSICNSGEISPQSFTGGHNSTNTSCYTTPLNSPPKLNLSMMDHQIRGNLAIHGNHFPGDPGFAERAARFSCFGNRNFGGQFALNVSDEMPQRVEQPRKPVGGSPMVNSLPENQEFGDSKEESSVSEQIPGGENGLKSQSDNNSSGRKRKAIPKGKEKVNPPPKAISKLGESNGKRSKSDESNEKEGSKEKQSKDSAKPEPPKDYIHVRARRGQATDSHSLAERVRREKISERMKFLQDLVPGCNKVTGKAVMLDEIINYVQSLQRQVEFLSMKLATVNPRVDPSMEALMSKDMFQSPGSLPHNMYPFETTSPTFPYAYHPSQPQNETPFPVNPMNPALRRNPDLEMPQTNGFSDAPAQASTFWEDDLQSFVQMGFGQIQNQAQNFHGTGQMKVEL